MSRLYDRLMTVINRDNEYYPSLREATIIEATNVSDFYFNSHIEKLTNELKNDFPSLAPPFQNFFIETNAPRVISNKWMIIGSLESPHVNKLSCRAWGIHCVAEDIGDDPRWDITASLYFEKSKKYEIHGPAWISRLLISKDGEIEYCQGGPGIGRFDEDERKKVFSKVFIEYVKKKHKSVKRVITDRDLGFQNIYFYPLYLAISFMHCKNVKLEEINPPDKLQKKHLKKHKQQLIRYHVVKIEQIKKTLRTEGMIENQGLKKALHICRGHFKDYRQSGLFGKIPGIYWWDSHVRGEKESGIIVKDYELKKPIKEVP